MRAVLQAENVPDDVEVSITLTDDAAVRELNRRYRGIDRPTDVLSFADDPPDAPASLFVEPEEVRVLGDVVISLPTAARQAEVWSRSLVEEVVFLTAHGLLHLLGWDDETPEDLEAMLRRQNEILSTLDG